MYDVKEMIQIGRQTMDENKALDLVLGDFNKLKELSEDSAMLANNAFLLGVAVGLRIGEAEALMDAREMIEKS